MSCAWCLGTECFHDEEVDITAYITFDNTLEIDDCAGNTAFMPVKFCPNCGDDLRAVNSKAVDS